MEAFVLAVRNFGIQPLMLFVQAFDFFEVRISADGINEVFSGCCQKNEKGQTFLVRIPQGVQLYVNELLLNAAVPLNNKSTLPELEIWTGEVKGEK